jgi:hypothetical protein
VPAWADEELRTMGGLSRREIILVPLHSDYDSLEVSG